MQSTMTGFDIAAIVDELEERLKGAKVINIYHVSDSNTLFLRLRLSGRTELLVLQAARRICCTDYALTMPERPSQFAVELRGELTGGIMWGISQLGFDRIVSIRLQVGQTDLELLVELLPRGNILLTKNGIIERAMFRRMMRDRRISRGEVYKPPPSNTIHPEALSAGDITPLLSSGEKIGQVIAKRLGYGPPYSDEICIRAGLRPDDVAVQGTDEKVEQILESVRLVYRMSKDHSSPRLYRDSTGQLSGFSAFELMAHSGDSSKEYKTMNQLVDDYFVEFDAAEKRMRIEEARKVEEERGSRAEERLRKTAEEMLERAKMLREDGKAIFGHLSDINELIDAARKGREARPFEEVEVIEILKGRERTVKIKVSERILELPLNVDASKTASSLFQEAKKLEEDYGIVSKRVDGQRQMTKAVEEVVMPERRAEKAWFENFRWFISSDNILVVCGKDASSNEMLVRKYAKPNNPIFHSDVKGAPFVLVQSNSETTHQETMDEAAQMAASHTTWAWQLGYASLDVFWVNASQLTKTPPSGEYLSRGAFMVRGKKNYFRGTQLGLAIAFMIADGNVRVVSAPVGAISNKTTAYVRIVPGTTERKRLAAEIKARLTELVPEGERESIKAMRLEEILAALPAKGGKMLR